MNTEITLCHVIIAVLATQVIGLSIAVFYALRASNEYRVKYEAALKELMLPKSVSIADGHERGVAE